MQNHSRITILKLTKGYHGLIALISIISIFNAFVEVGLIQAISMIIDNLNSNRTKDINVVLCVLYLAIFLFSTSIMCYIHSYLIYIVIKGRLYQRVILVLYSSVLNKNLSYHRKNLPGKISTMINTTSSSIVEFLIKIFDVFIFSFFYILLTFLTLNLFNSFLLIPFFSWLVLYVIVLYFNLPLLKKSSKIHNKSQTILIGKINDILSNIKLVKCTPSFNFRYNPISSGLSRYKKVNLHLNWYRLKIDVIIEVINYTLISSTMIMSLSLWKSNEISSGMIAGAMALSMTINGMSKWIMWETASFFEHFGIINNGLNSINKATSENLTVEKNKLLINSIEYKKVRFLNSDGDVILNDVSLRFDKGERIAIFGSSGSGKSTLIDLLFGFVDSYSGIIHINGKTINSFGYGNIRDSISYIEQGNPMINCNIYNNLLFSCDDVNISSGLSKFSFLDFISSSKHLRTKKATTLSGGQRQRLNIARALLESNSLIVFDEPTSALDKNNKRLVMDCINNIKNSIIIIITHDKDVLNYVDRIIYLDKGKVIHKSTTDIV